MSAVTVSNSAFSFDVEMTAGELLPMLESAGITLRSVPQKFSQALASGFFNLVAVKEEVVPFQTNCPFHENTVCNNPDPFCDGCTIPAPF